MSNTGESRRLSRLHSCASPAAPPPRSVDPHPRLAMDVLAMVEGDRTPARHPARSTVTPPTRSTVIVAAARLGFPGTLIGLSGRQLGRSRPLAHNDDRDPGIREVRRRGCDIGGSSPASSATSTPTMWYGSTSGPGAARLLHGHVLGLRRIAITDDRPAESRPHKRAGTTARRSHPRRALLDGATGHGCSDSQPDSPAALERSGTAWTKNGGDVEVRLHQGRMSPTTPSIWVKQIHSHLDAY